MSKFRGFYLLNLRSFNKKLLEYDLIGWIHLNLILTIERVD